MKKTLLAVLMVLFTSLPASGAETVKLGALFPFSGPLAVLGEESFRGLTMAVEEVNQNGGILGGRQIELIKGDAVDPNQAVSEARRLISVADVKVIFGTYSSSLAFAASQVTEQAGVPFFELGAISDPITQRKFKYLFRTCPMASNFGVNSIIALKEAVAPVLGVPAGSLRVAVIHEDGQYGTAVAAGQVEQAKKEGINIIEVLPYSLASVDMSSLVMRLKGAAIDVVLQTSYMNDTVLFFRQAQEAGFKFKAAIGAGGGYSLNDSYAALGEAMEGALDVDFTQMNTNLAMAPGLDVYQQTYKAKYGVEPNSGHSLTNYFGGKAVLDIIDKAGSLDKDAIRNQAVKTDIPSGNSVTGWGVKFDETGQNVNANTYLMQWQDGKLLTVWPDKAAVTKIRLGK
jgi:branched-chain amino acid transport system substrate-binding protein